jgi:hypothetical protein
LYNEAIFGLTAAVSFVTFGILAWSFAKSKGIPRLLWSLAFFILGLSTALISIQGLGLLSNPLVAPLDSLIPGLLAAGLLMSRKKTWGTYFLSYVMVIFCIIFALSFPYGALAAPYVMLVHFPSGLVIFILPIYLSFAKKMPVSALLVGIGGLLIGIGGMALATLSTSFQILPQNLVLNILAPLFLSMTVLIALGILTTPSWGFVRTKTEAQSKRDSTLAS